MFILAVLTCRVSVYLFHTSFLSSLVFSILFWWYVVMLCSPSGAKHFWIIRSICLLLHLCAVIFYVADPYLESIQSIGHKWLENHQIWEMKMRQIAFGATKFLSYVLLIRQLCMLCARYFLFRYFIFQFCCQKRCWKYAFHLMFEMKSIDIN